MLGRTGLRTSSSSIHPKSKGGLLIGLPHNFRQISSIIDVDILPETHRRVQLHKHGTNKPLGFYIRDGVSMRVTTHGVEKVRSTPTSLRVCVRLHHAYAERGEEQTHTSEVHVSLVILSRSKVRVEPCG